MATSAQRSCCATAACSCRARTRAEGWLPQPVARDSGRGRLPTAQHLDRLVSDDATRARRDEHARTDADARRQRDADEEGPVRCGRNGDERAAAVVEAE